MISRLHAIAKLHVQRDIVAAIMPLRPSVCLSHSGIVSKWLNISLKFFHRLVVPSF